MRLICPNCGAQYEVPDDVIPETGRDVQCSNCGDTWFQKHPSQDQDLAEDLGQPLDEAHWEEDDTGFGEEAEPGPAPEYEQEPAPEPEPEYEPVPAPEPEPEPEAEDIAEVEDEPWAEDTEDWLPETETWDEAETAEWDEEEATAEEQHPEPQPRPLDPELRDVLREEAEREREARATEGAGGLETQPDLGLDEPSDEASRREREARLRMARMRGLSEKEALAAAGLSQLGANNSRRDLLPDIEEINSTLRKESERQPIPETDEESPAAPAPQKSGFSRGFAFILLIVALLLAVYVFAPRIAEMVPQLKPTLDAYIDMVNRARLWLDGQIAGLLQWLDGMTSEAPAGDAPAQPTEGATSGS
ncbi:zinc-ribbon domain-containing protein [Marimonas lutisalis]|uniref:zinc-ribbon domain-containing protein n=1 Tax=Marimonas lutisalis TaxID=2545756 RepID=UPI0010F45F89|nr:zinc-ribbon domain-containing protein [Marimonas lutisalis]